MTLNENIDELQFLTHEERRLLCRRALALEEAAEAVAPEHSAREGFALLDRIEAEDAGRGQSG